MRGLAILLLSLILVMALQAARAAESDERLLGVPAQESGDRPLITFYQNRLSIHDGARCLFVPTCSEFFRQAADRYGLFWGVIMTLERLLYREHRWSLNHYPLSEDGQRHIDPVYCNFILDAEAYDTIR
jgi:putative component of membrane protein insertase Oxa1/YidC/SpoIIIJ protein YidD